MSPSLRPVPYARMRPILVIEQEWRLEGAGLLGKRLTASGVPFRRLQMWRQDGADLRLDDFAAVVPLGGNAHAWDEEGHPHLRVERELLARAVQEDVPVLGICLGAQLLARSQGAEVYPSGFHEIGWAPIHPTPVAAADPLFAHLDGRPAGVYHWHMDAFDLPAGAVHLASSELQLHQAFRIGNAWGLQFHPEVDYETFTTWIANHPGACADLDIDEDALRAAVREGSARDHEWRARLFDAFLQVVAEREGQ